MLLVHIDVLLQNTRSILQIHGEENKKEHFLNSVLFFNPLSSARRTYNYVMNESNKS